jgi:hypothetical protein
MVLDQSGSMDWDSGIPGQRRIDVLRSAAPIFVDVMPDNGAVGIVTFDRDAHPAMPVTQAALASRKARAKKSGHRKDAEE